MSKPQETKQKLNKILILSGDPVFKLKNIEALTQTGLKVALAADLLEGVLKIDKESFDVIIIDEELPDSDNYLACRRIRHSSEIPIILLGSQADEDVWDKVEELGFDFYLKKPVNPTDLVARVKAVLRWAAFREKVTEVPVATTAIQETKAVSPEAAEPEIAPSQPIVVAASISDEAPVKVWQKVKVAKLIDSLVTGRLSEIIPEIDLSLEDGFTYPEADKILGTTGKETVQILEALAKEEILRRFPFVKLLLSPEGSADIVPVVHCPHCDSNNIVKGEVIEHFGCGYVGLEGEFKVELKYICPKCKKEIRLIGADCRSLGIGYRCNSCRKIFHSLVTKFRYLTIGESYTRNELKEVLVDAYYFNEAKKDWLEFELGPKPRLIDFLRYCGYEVEELAKATGKSGTVHTVDILATRKNIAGKHTIGIGIFVAKPGETEVIVDELFDFLAKTYDIGIDEKVIITIPKLSFEAQKLAKRQRIKVFENKDLRILSLGQPQPVSEIKEEIKPGYAEAAKPEILRFDPKAQFIDFLKSRGYQIIEKAKVKGRSGAEHILDIYAQKDNGILIHTVAAAVAINKAEGEIDVDEVTEFDARTYDVGIHEKVFIAIPKLSSIANQFAKQQKIKVFEAKDIATLSQS